MHGGITLTRGITFARGVSHSHGGITLARGCHTYTRGSHSHGGMTLAQGDDTRMEVVTLAQGDDTCTGVITLTWQGNTLARRGITLAQGKEGERETEEKGRRKMGKKRQEKGKGRKGRNKFCYIFSEEKQQIPISLHDRVRPWARVTSWAVSASCPAAGTAGVWGGDWGFCPNLRGFSPRSSPASLGAAGKVGFSAWSLGLLSQYW